MVTLDAARRERMLAHVVGESTSRQILLFTFEKSYVDIVTKLIKKHKLNVKPTVITL